MSDPLWDDILQTAGSEVIYRAASGLEKSLADTDAVRLITTYAELPRDQWDPYRISYRNLGYLAWAMGVNLWEDDWPEEFRRYWVANQWTFKSQRGSLPGLKIFVHALSAGGKMTAEVVRVIRPPATTYPLPTLTDAQRAAYVARFAQLRAYPFVARVQLPYLCFLGKHHQADGTTPLYQRNGAFIGPLWKLYPTNQDAGGKYTRTYTIWDRGVETTLTHRQIAKITMGPSAGWGFTPGVSAYDDQVILPLAEDIPYFMAEPGKGLGDGAKHGIFAGKAPKLRTITVSRSGPLPLTQGKAQYQTVLPSDDLLELLPEKVTQAHPRRMTECYPRHINGDILFKKFLPRTNAWQFLFDRWYLFDADRVPDYRKTGVYMGHTRFGIPKYTAEALIRVRVKYPRFWLQTSGYLYKYLRPRGNKEIEKLRRAVTASMALRDTVLINTNATRKLQVADIVNATGRAQVGQWVSN